MLDSLLKLLPENYTNSERELIAQAYHYAEKAHEGQKRASGEPFISHCQAVSTILAELKMPPVVVAAGLLHDTVEDTPTKLEEIRSTFGEEISLLVDGVTKLTHLPRLARGEHHGENASLSVHPDDELFPEEGQRSGRKRDLRIETIRKTFMAMGEDIRVILIKLADRLHNMRTLGYMPEAKRKRIAEETLEIYAPLANRLGIWQIKWEIEDLAFRYSNPEKYKEIADQLAERRSDREKQIDQIIQRLRSVLERSNIRAEISGRPKHIYSIYRKMVEKGKTFDLVRDLRGVRLIVPDIPSCYAALGIIHTHWRPYPHEFDDYIAAPKDNFYQSIHTAVLYEDGKPLEVQIRTHEMHQNAEYGIAAHWRYKERGKRDDVYEERINWLRKLMEWRQEVEDAQEFVEGIRTDVFQDRVYAFTPRGDIIDLPAGATPIDFAYLVHTEIGNRCRGAKVNGKLVTLDYALRTGDQVEVLTAKQGGPSRDWLNPALGLVKTQRARSKIRFWFKKQDREQNIIQGKAMLDKELRRLGLTEGGQEKILSLSEFSDIEDLYEELGCGDLSLNKLITQLSEIGQEKPDEAPTHPSSGTPGTEAITILGLKGLLTNMGKCCNPAPGDEIIGYITRGRGATIHRSDCPNILRVKDRERLIKVSWGEANSTFPVQIQVKAYDRQGLLGDISTVLGNENVNLTNITVKTASNLAIIHMTVEIGNIAQLSRVLTRVENLPNVMEAHRLNPG